MRLFPLFAADPFEFFAGFLHHQADLPPSRNSPSASSTLRGENTYIDNTCLDRPDRSHALRAFRQGTFLLTRSYGGLGDGVLGRVESV